MSVVDICRMAVVLRDAICRTVRDVTIDMKEAPVRERAGSPKIFIRYMHVGAAILRETCEESWCRGLLASLRRRHACEP
jgi:hypothetical protein